MFGILEGMRVDHGGDYGMLHAIICQDVTRLKRAGLNLRVFMDGKGRKLKAKATMGRWRSDIYSRFANFTGTPWTEAARAWGQNWGLAESPSTSPAQR